MRMVTQWDIAPYTGYWLMRDIHGDVSGIFDARADFYFSDIDELFGTGGWIPSNISKAEFDTYKEFGIKEYKL